MKCNIETGYCSALYARTNEPGFSGKGLITIKQLSEDKKEKILGVIYKSDKADKGLMLNNCPWCGESLKWWEDK